MPITTMVLNTTLHLKKMMNLILLLLLLPHHHGGAEAQSPMQPAPPSTVWDVTSVCVIIGALLATLLSVTAFSMFLRRFAQSDTAADRPHSSASPPAGGVHPEILQTFPTFVYSSVSNHLKDQEPLQCAVCISDFNSDDTLRLLPQCNHVFHPPCIDAWLSSHPTCPVCRAYLNCSHHGSNDFAIWVDKETDQRESPRCEEARGGCENGDEEGKGVPEWKSKLKLSRSNSTGHDSERYTLSVPEEVKKCIMVNHGVMMLQRSASYNIVGSSMKGLCWSDSEGSNRGK